MSTTNVIRLAIDQSDKSLSEIADAAGISERHLRRLRRNGCRSMEVKQQVVAAAGVPPIAALLFEQTGMESAVSYAPFLQEFLSSFVPEMHRFQACQHLPSQRNLGRMTAQQVCKELSKIDERLGFVAAE